MIGRAAKKSIIVLILLIYFILSTSTVSANNVTFSNTNLVDGQIIINEITESGTVYIGTYNSSDTVSLEDGHSYVFTLKPSLSTTSFMTPEGFFNFINNNKDNLFAIFIMLLFVAGLAGIILRVIT
jgi:hypothetical protein